eukprot:GHVS01063425.1.p1 GENE.GHVS01063425.1~~GHVS01063425.1.p1  ORF type:complete len:474 (+),score=41.84 GHVS01063425.1:90-1511(+)
MKSLYHIIFIHHHPPLSLLLFAFLTHTTLVNSLSHVMHIGIGTVTTGTKQECVEASHKTVITLRPTFKTLTGGAVMDESLAGCKKTDNYMKTVLLKDNKNIGYQWGQNTSRIVKLWGPDSNFEAVINDPLSEEICVVLRNSSLSFTLEFAESAHNIKALDNVMVGLSGCDVCIVADDENAQRGVYHHLMSRPDQWDTALFPLTGADMTIPKINIVESDLLAGPTIYVELSKVMSDNAFQGLGTAKLGDRWLKHKDGASESRVVIFGKKPVFRVVKETGSRYVVKALQNDVQNVAAVEALMANISEKEESKAFVVDAHDCRESRNYASAIMQNADGNWRFTVGRHVLNDIRGEAEKGLFWNKQLLTWPKTFRQAGYQLAKVNVIFEIPEGWTVTSDRKDLWEKAETAGGMSMVTFIVAVESEMLTITRLLPLTATDENGVSKTVSVSCDTTKEIRNYSTYQVDKAAKLVSLGRE